MSYTIKKLLCSFTAAALIATLCCPLSFASQGTAKQTMPPRETPPNSPVTVSTEVPNVSPEPEAPPDANGDSAGTHTRGDAANSEGPTQEPIPSADSSETHTRGDAAESAAPTQEPTPLAGAVETSTPAGPASEEKQSSPWMIVFVFVALVLSMISVAMSVAVFLIMKAKLTEAKQSANGLRDQLAQIKFEFDSIQSTRNTVSRSAVPSASHNSSQTMNGVPGGTVQPANNAAFPGQAMNSVHGGTVQPANNAAFPGQAMNSVPSGTVQPANNAAFPGQAMNSVPSGTVQPANNAAFPGQAMNSVPGGTVQPANNAAFPGQAMNNMADNRGSAPSFQKKAEPEAAHELTKLHLVSKKKYDEISIKLLYYSTEPNPENSELHIYSNGECHYVTEQKKNIKKLIGRGYLDLFNIVVDGHAVAEQNLTHFSYNANLKDAKPAQLDPAKMIDGQPISVLAKGTLYFER